MLTHERGFLGWQGWPCTALLEYLRPTPTLDLCPSLISCELNSSHASRLRLTSFLRLTLVSARRNASASLVEECEEYIEAVRSRQCLSFFLQSRLQASPMLNNVCHTAALMFSHCIARAFWLLSPHRCNCRNLYCTLKRPSESKCAV